MNGTVSDIVLTLDKQNENSVQQYIINRGSPTNESQGGTQGGIWMKAKGGYIRTKSTQVRWL